MIGQKEEWGQRPAPDPGSHTHLPLARSGLLRLAEALAFRGDLEVVNSTVRAVVTTLRSGEKCGVEPELIGKGNSGQGSVRTSGLAAWHRGPSPRWARMGPVERSGSLPGRFLPLFSALAESPQPVCPRVRWSRPTHLGPLSWRDTKPALSSAVLRGLIEVGSPHLEELLAALFATTSPTLRPVAVVSSLLLQEKEPAASGEPETDGCG